MKHGYTPLGKRLTSALEPVMHSAPGRFVAVVLGKLGFSGKTGLIAIPYLWLTLFFLIPFTFVLKISLADGTPATASMHGFFFEPGPGDQVLGTVGGERFDGLAWGLRRRIGAGTLYVIGGEVDPAARSAVYRNILNDAEVPMHPMPERVVRVPQSSPSGRQAWALVNADETAQTIDLPSAGVDLLTGNRVSHLLNMPAHSNAFVAFDA